MTISFSCKIYEKPVAKKHNAVECDNCKLWVHIKCNKIIKEIFNLLMEDNTPCLWSVQNLFFPSMTLTKTTSFYYPGQKNKIYNIFEKEKSKWTHSN